MPIYCSERKKISQDALPLGMASETLAEKKAERRLEPTAWVIAWEGYAIAAAILSQVFVFRACLCVPGRAGCRFVPACLHSSAVFHLGAAAQAPCARDYAVGTFRAYDGRPERRLYGTAAGRLV